VSDFQTLNTALTGLLAHRRALDVIGHNVANATTEGFTRRRVDLQSIGANEVPGVFSRSDRIGAGVRIADVTRIRDEFLESRALREHGLSSRLGTEATVLGRIERSLPEPSDVGIAAQLADYWAAWDDVGNRPDDTSTRIALLERAGTLTQTLHRVSSELVTLRDNQVEEASALVAEVNATAARVAELNGRINDAVAAGMEPHDLADQRDQLILSLSKLIGVTTRPGGNGQTDVFIGGSTLVRGNLAETVRVAEPGPLTGPFAGTGLPRMEIQWSVDGGPVMVEQGRVAGLLAGVNVHVPQAITELDGVAATLVASVNALHVAGADLSGTTGRNFFDPTGVRASTIAISADVAGQPDRIAAASATGGTLDASVAQSLAALAGAPSGADAVYKTMVGRIAVTTQAADRRERIQADVVKQADDARLSVSGVNLDEELTNLIMEQRAYEASSRLLTTIDQTLDTLINRTGMVGR
jgi:flagellar hook-associated protein 1 FlgK